MLGIVMNKRWMEDFASRVSARLEAAKDACSNRELYFIVFDNCAYAAHTTYESTVKAGELIQTVNWLRVPLNLMRFRLGVARGLWHNSTRTFLTRRMCAT